MGPSTEDFSASTMCVSCRRDLHRQDNVPDLLQDVYAVRAGDSANRGPPSPGNQVCADSRSYQNTTNDICNKPIDTVKQVCNSSPRVTPDMLFEPHFYQTEASVDTMTNKKECIQPGTTQLYCVPNSKPVIDLPPKVNHCRKHGHGITSTNKPREWVQFSDTSLTWPNTGQRTPDTLPLTPENPFSDMDDIANLVCNQKYLKGCCFYYGHLSNDSARKLLRSSAEGTFLVRDSSDPRHLYALSVKTSRGTTSVRIKYHQGRFKLDCEDRLEKKIVSFPTVLELVQWYVQQSQSAHNKAGVWLENSGRKDTRVVLRTPLLKQVSSLAHLCIKAVHRGAKDSGLVTDNTELRLKLMDYPFSV